MRGTEGDLLGLASSRGFATTEPHGAVLVLTWLGKVSNFRPISRRYLCKEAHAIANFPSASGL